MMKAIPGLKMFLQRMSLSIDPPCGRGGSDGHIGHKRYSREAVQSSLGTSVDSKMGVVPTYRWMPKSSS